MTLYRHPIFSLALNTKKKWRRSACGSELVEFNAALVLLIIGFVLPLADLSVLPIRWLLAQEVITSEVRELAQSKSFSDAIERLADGSSLNTQLNRIGGVQLLSANCALVITMLNTPYEIFVASEPKNIRAEWLPNGNRSPCSYEIELSTNIELSPLIMLRNSFIKDIPGLTKPFVWRVKERAHWESYGRNPTTKKFYINE